MRPKPVKLSATTSEQTHDMGTGLSVFTIRNDGSDDVYIDFDASIDENNSWKLLVGESMTITNKPFVRLYYKAVASTATLYVLKIIQ